MRNVHSSIFKHALKHPQKLAVKDSEVSFTFSELDRFSSKIANYLIDKKVEIGDCVSVLLQVQDARKLPFSNDTYGLNHLSPKDVLNIYLTRIQETSSHIETHLQPSNKRPRLS